MDSCPSWNADELPRAALHEAQVAAGPSLRLDGLVWAALNRYELPEGLVSICAPRVRVDRPGGRRWYHRLTSEDHFSESEQKAARVLRQGWSWAVREVGGGVFEGCITDVRGPDDKSPLRFTRLALTTPNAILAAALFAEIKIGGIGR